MQRGTLRRCCLGTWAARASRRSSQSTSSCLLNANTFSSVCFLLTAVFEVIVCESIAKMPLFGKSKKQKSSSATKVKLQGQAPTPNGQHFAYQNAASTPYLPIQTQSWPSQPQYNQPMPPVQQRQAVVPYHGPAPPGIQYSTSPPPVYSIHPPKQKWASTTNLLSTDPFTEAIYNSVKRTGNCWDKSVALCDQLADRLNDVISLMDEETFGSDKKDIIFEVQEQPVVSYQPVPAQPALRGGYSRTNLLSPSKPKQKHVKANSAPDNACPITKTVINATQKAALYANSSLPQNLPPLRLYMPTYPLLCLAARNSLKAYVKPRTSAESSSYVTASYRLGTKTMVLKSVPVDDMNTIVFAIRGTAGIWDWTVNIRDKPTPPTGFLDDPGNLCHAGFLDVARKMVKPVAARLRQLLEENPSRAHCSLMITGHSAGGAVAALLYCHMLSEDASTKSELNILTGCFKRIHCVTFGAPPVTLLPLQKPVAAEKRLRKSLFLSFVNEGDLVARAEMAYMLSLVQLYRAPVPQLRGQMYPANNASSTALVKSQSRANLALPIPPTNKVIKWSSRPHTAPAPSPASTSSPLPRPSTSTTWRVPQATLSNAGRIVALRIPWNSNGSDEDVKACITTDEQMRHVIFGDPNMHRMDVYARRIEVLATRAVTGRLIE